MLADLASTDQRGAGSGAIMDKEQLTSMSIDELWALHTDVDEILAARIVAKKAELEKRLAQLQQPTEGVVDQRPT